jgi:creatinine amidohydrolase/Fe(II)-dependent formamide hydrolase-like protein
MTEVASGSPAKSGQAMKLLHAAELTWDRLRQEAQRGSLFLLCVAPLEDHASHLPSGTDPIICEAMAVEVAKRVSPVEALEPEPGVTNAVLLPVWYQGSSLLRSLGCLRWKSSTVTQTLLEYGRELDELGVRRLVLVSSHGAMDHLKALEKAARVLQKTTRLNVLAPSGPLLNNFVMGKFNDELTDLLGRPFTPEEKDGLKGDVHAAAWETSLLLHIAPRLVEKTFHTLPRHEIFEGKRLKFRALKYHRGYFGSPAVASEELGRAAFDLLCGKMKDLLTDFLARPLRHDHRRRLSHRRKVKKRVPKSRLPLNIAVGIAVGWVLFRALDRQN